MFDPASGRLAAVPESSMPRLLSVTTVPDRGKASPPNAPIVTLRL